MRVILQHFSRSTRFANLCTAPNSKYKQNFVHIFSKLNIEFFVGFENFEESSQILAEKYANTINYFHFLEFVAKFRQNFI